MLPGTAIASAWPFLAVAFALGACVGSFLNVCIHRIPADESVVHPGSRCPNCRTPIAWYDNVPLLSWLILGARCRGCRMPIAARYPFVEAVARGPPPAPLWRLRAPPPPAAGLAL